MAKGGGSGMARGRARPMRRPPRSTRDMVGVALIGCVLLGGTFLFLSLFLGLWSLYTLLPPQPTPYPAAISKAEPLQQYPEYRLYYPGATVIAKGGRDAEIDRFGSTGASAGATLGTDGSPGEIIAFYARELAARGWVNSDIDGVSDTTKLDARGWRKGHVAFRLSITDPRAFATPIGYRTTYEFVLRADRPDAPSWQTQP